MKRCKVLICLLLCIIDSSVAIGYKTRNVVIVVIDGSRYSETFGDSTHRYIPFMWNKLRPLGTIYTKFYNEKMTITCSGHSTVLSGAWQKLSNDGSQRPDKPTMFEYFRKETDAPERECAVILGKDKLSILSYSKYKGYSAPFGAKVFYGNNNKDDIHTWENTKKVLTTQHPRLAIINFGQIDSKAHDKDWRGYIRAIQQVDSIVCLVWDLLQNDSFYKDVTTLFVVNDHGRHTFDFTDHGCKCEGCKHLLFMMIGPDTKAGIIDSSYRQQVDIAPTIGELLGFSTPFADGSSLFSESVKKSSSTSFFNKHPKNNEYPFITSLWPGKSVDIFFELSTSSGVSVSICNLQGKVIKSIPETYMSPGQYKKRLDLNSLSGGNYLVKLETDEFSLSNIIPVY